MDLGAAMFFTDYSMKPGPLGQALEAYQAFDSGVPKKFVIDPHHSVRN